MSHKKWGTGLVITGAVVQVLGGVAEADATLNNIPYNQTSVGSITGPVEDAFHIPSGMLGWVIIAGGLIVWFVVPHIKA